MNEEVTTVCGPRRRSRFLALEGMLRLLGIPQGAAPVAGGLVFSAATSYVFLIVASRALTSQDYSAVAALWSIAFLTTGGIFLPVEQEVTRALAVRRSLRLGGGSVVSESRRVALGIVAIVWTIIGLSSSYISRRIFDDDWSLVVALVAMVLGYAVLHVVRGTFAGYERFRLYGVALGLEGATRAAAAILLAVLGVEVAGAYGLALALAPFVAASLAWRHRADVHDRGPAVALMAVARPVALLLVGALLSALLLNIGPLAVQMLASSREDDAAGRFLNGLVVARVPLFFFAAVQAAILPKFSSLAATRRHREFLVSVRRLMVIVLALGGVAGTLAVTIGPNVMRILFGDDFTLGRRDLFLIALASALYMAAQALAQAVIALDGHRAAALAWLAGVIGFCIVTALGRHLFTRVEAGLIAGSGVAAALMAMFLRQRFIYIFREVSVPRAASASPETSVPR